MQTLSHQKRQNIASAEVTTSASLSMFARKYAKRVSQKPQGRE